MIDRCLCKNRTFAELLDLARAESLSARELADRTGCGKQCGWCVAYLKRVVADGIVDFDQILPREKFD